MLPTAAGALVPTARQIEPPTSTECSTRRTYRWPVTAFGPLRKLHEVIVPVTGELSV